MRIHNALIPPLLGMNDFLHRDTLRTFLLRFDADSLRSLELAHDKVLNCFNVWACCTTPSSMPIRRP